MEMDKIKNLTDEELKSEEKNSSEQLFRLKFQVRSGQQDGVKNLRSLKKDIARMKTVARHRELHGGAPVVSAATTGKKTRKAAK